MAKRKDKTGEGCTARTKTGGEINGTSPSLTFDHALVKIG